jgi:hypothetical protein
MSNRKLFRENAYYILGLDTSASSKEINNRADEITRYLQIDEIPEYDSDIPFWKPERTIDSVNKAKQRLSDGKKKISEMFFWFTIEDDADEAAMEAIQNEDIESAISIWKSKQEVNINGYAEERNLATLFSIGLSETEEEYDGYLTSSILYWREIFSAETQWNQFKEIYKLYDDVGYSEAILNDFRNKAEKIIADFYADIAKAKNDNNIYVEYQEYFDTKSDNFEKEIVEPLLIRLQGIGNSLGESIIFDESKNKLTDASFEELTKSIKDALKIDEKIDELIPEEKSYGNTTVITDEVGEQFRTASVQVFNGIDIAVADRDYALSQDLLSAAIEIGRSRALVNRLQDDIEQSSALREEAVTSESKRNEFNLLMAKFKIAMDAHNFTEAYSIVCRLLEFPMSTRDKFALTELKNKLQLAAISSEQKKSRGIGCIVAIIIVVVIAILIFHPWGGNTSTNTSNYTTDGTQTPVVAEESEPTIDTSTSDVEDSQPPKVELKEKTLPKSGKTWYLGSKDVKAENKGQVNSGSYSSIYITVPSNGENYYVLAKYSVDGGAYEPMKAILIRSGKTEELRLPQWTNADYMLYYASGTTWYGRKNLFGDETQYSKADTVFTSDDILNSNWEIKLISQVGGNLSESAASPSDFQ